MLALALAGTHAMTLASFAAAHEAGYVHGLIVGLLIGLVIGDVLGMLVMAIIAAGRDTAPSEPPAPEITGRFSGAVQAERRRIRRPVQEHRA